MASKVTGFRETARALRKVAAFPKKAVSGASRKALNPMLAASKANLKANRSYHRGVLSRSMKVRQLKSTSALSEWVVSATGRGVGISHLVEFGTAPHFQPKRNRMHPGADAKPFLTPAYEAHDDQAVQTFVNELGQGMVNYAAQVAFRGK